MKNLFVMWLFLMVITLGLSAQSIPHDVLGYGTAQTISWRPDGQLFAVGSVAGVYLYTPEMDMVAHLKTLSVHHMAWHSDGTKIAITVSQPDSPSQKTIEIWDVASAARTQQFAAPDANLYITTFAWQPQSAVLAIGANQRLWFWDTNTGILLNAQTLTFEDSVRALVWSFDGKWLAIGTRNTFYLRNMVNNTYHELPVSYATDIAWASDNKHFAVSRGRISNVTDSEYQADNSLQIWHIDSIMPQINIQAGHVVSVAWSSDGQYLATGDADGWVQVWSPEDGRLIASLFNTSAAKQVRWQPNTYFLMSLAEDSVIRLWNISLENEVYAHRDVKTLATHGSAVHGLAWLPDASGILAFHEGGSLRKWQLDDPQTSKFIGYVANFNQFLGLDNTNSRLFFSNPENAILSVHAENLAVQSNTGRALDFPPILAWHPLTNTVASVEQQKTGEFLIFLWNPATHQRVKTIACPICTLGSAMAWNFSGDTLAIAGENPMSGSKITLWDTRDSSLQETFPLSGSRVIGLDWSIADRLAIVEEDTVTLWDIATNQVIKQWALPGATIARWDASGQLLAVGDTNGVIHLYHYE
jgi:WD40 repeat protein